jgi:hypothetical protein
MRSRISFRRTFLGLSMGAIARGEEGVLSSAFRIANAFIMLCFLQLNEITLVSSIALSRAFHN